MSHEYDFGEGGKVALTASRTKHEEMFQALTTLGPMGARIAKYINELKGQINNRNETIARLGGGARSEERQRVEHKQEFATARALPIGPSDQRAAQRPTEIFDGHTPGPWRMLRSGMIKMGGHWICAVTARNRIHNGPLIEAAPEMLAMLERMLRPAAASEAQQIISEAKDLVHRARKPGWVAVPRTHDEAI